MRKLISLVVGVVIGIAAYTQLTLFVVQPIGLIPEGVTVVLWRRSAVLNFVDSADAVCQRTAGGVSVWCRMGALAGVIKNNPVLIRLSYSDTLYSISTGGKTYDR
jgi:hypothetical protein